MYQIFLYGTLKNGFKANYMLKGQKFISEAILEPKYRLFKVSSYPGMVENVNGIAVKGELWGVDEKCLNQLDNFEGIEYDLYHREIVDVANPKCKAFAYIWQRPVDGLTDCGEKWN